MRTTWGTLGVRDAEALAQLVADLAAVDRFGVPQTADDLRYHLDDPLLDLAEGTLAARIGDRVVAYGCLPVSQSADQRGRLRLLGGVHPDFRRRGYGRRVLDWALDIAPRLYGRHYPGRPLELYIDADDRSAGMTALFQSAGLERVRRFLEMRVDLTATAGTTVTAPEGIHLTPWSAELDEGARSVRNMAFSDHRGSVEYTREGWRKTITGSRAFRPEASFLALDGARVVGILLTMRFAAEPAAPGERSAWISIIGTLREWRGRGVAGTLLAHTLGELRAQGYASAGLGVGPDNDTGVIELYERMGFTATHPESLFVRRYPRAHSYPRVSISAHAPVLMS